MRHFGSAGALVEGGRVAPREYALPAFKEALNSAVRFALTQGKSRRGCFVQKSFSLGHEQNFRWDKALDTASALEDEELSRKLSLRK